MLSKFKNRKSTTLLAFALVSLTSAGASFAQTGVDTSSVTAQLTAAATAGGVIGLAYLAMVAGIKLYKWVRSAM